MTGERVIQLVPRLGSRLDGVADYARTLGGALCNQERLRIEYMSGDPADVVHGDPSAVPYSRLREQSAQELLACLEKSEADVLLLHYVNYGYERRGCPFWLVNGLRQWKRKMPFTRLVTMFHELYASGPPWRSSFWTSPLQRTLARDLFSVSNAVATNRELSKRWLLHSSRISEEGVTVMPVFSSLGEPAQVTQWTRRRSQMVVAGRSGAADRAYGRCRAQLIAACNALQIDEIVDLGARFDRLPDRIDNIRISVMGHLTPAEASSVLSNARAGFLDYPSDFLGKSTVFAAYAAHDLVPVVSQHRGPDETGLREGVNYWVPSHGATNPRNLESIAHGASTWYSGHKLEIQARCFAKMLQRR